MPEQEEKQFRRQKPKGGFRTFWMLLLVVSAGLVALVAGVSIRERLPPLWFLQKEAPPPDVPPPATGITLTP